MAEFVLHKDIAHRLSQYLIMWQKNMNNSILHDASQQPIWLKKTSYLVDEELDVV
ncbi:hypothetical protein GW750_08730 [bacterium]|nr:hypothetical protein [bacterium]